MTFNKACMVIHRSKSYNVDMGDPHRNNPLNPIGITELNHPWNKVNFKF